MSPFRSRRGGTWIGTDVQPEEEVLAEAPVSDAGFEIEVGGREYPSVDSNGLAPANPGQLAVLQDAQELRLELERHLCDLVEKKRSPMGELEFSGLPLDGAREGAPLVTEELAFEQVAWNRGAVDRNEGPAPAGSGSGSARAISSLPVPLSPCKRIDASLVATRPIVL